MPRERLGFLEGIKEMISIGIDPGTSGGIVAIDANSVIVAATKMPETASDIVEWFNELDDNELDSKFATLEKVASSPQMGVRSAFTFGRGRGVLEGVLCALQIPFEEVSPYRWQKDLSCLTKGDKNVTKRKAQQLWPDTKITHYIADAALLAVYGRLHNSRRQLASN